MDPVGRTCAVVLRQALRGLFHFRDHGRVEQFAQVSLAQQFPQLVLVHGESLSPAFCQRRVAVIHKVGHIAEEQRRSKWRRLARLHYVHTNLALLNSPQGFQQRGHVENIAQAFPIGLEQQRE